MEYSYGLGSTGGSRVLWELKDVRKRYGGRLVIDVRKLQLREGESVCLVGTNGSGKSTLLRILAGITTVSSGTIACGDAIATARKGYMPQSGGFNPDLTVREHIRECRVLHGRSEYMSIGEEELVARLGLSDMLDRTIGTLSGGYQKLANLFGVLSAAPTVLFLDEPYSGLDEKHRDAVDGTMRRVGPELVFLATTGHARVGMGEAVRYIKVTDGTVEEDS